MDRQLVLLPAPRPAAEPQPRTIYELGYGTSDPEQFFKRIPDLTKVYDVRREPKGTDPAFSQTNLEARLGEFYEHLQAVGNRLGTPLGEWNPCGKIETVQFTLERLTDELFKGSSFVLLGAPKDWNYCHRRVIADILKKTIPHVKVIHL